MPVGRAVGVVVDACLVLAIAAGLVARLLGLPLHVADSGDEWGNAIAPFRILHERGDPHVFLHPALYYYVTAAAYGAVFLVLKATGLVANAASMADAFALDQRLFILTARAVSLLSAALTLAALYVFGRRLWSARAGLLAAALLALQPLHVFYSKTVRVDALFVLLFVVAFAAIARILERPSRRAYAVAGLLAGLATGANYNGGILVVWLLAAHLLRRHHSASTPIPVGRRELAVAVGLMAAAFLATNPYSLLNLATFAQNFAHQSALLWVVHPGWEGRGPLYYGEHFAAANPAFAALAVIAVAVVAALGTRVERFVLSLPVAYFALFSAIQTRDERFMLPALALFALVAGGLPSVLGRSLAGHRVAALTWPLPVYGLVALALAWQARASLTVPQPVPHVVLARPDGILLDWIERHVPRRSRVAVESGIVPLLDTLKDPSPFPRRLRESLVTLRPGLDQDFLGLVHIGWQTYDPALITERRIDYAIVSPRTVGYIERGCATYPQACAFHRELRARGRVVFETPDAFEPAVVYAIGSNSGHH